MQRRLKQRQHFKIHHLQEILKLRNIGKISETVLNRSVIKPIEQSKVGLKEGVSVGADCAFFSDIAIASGLVSYKDSRACEHAIIGACNNLYAGGVKPQAITLNISMPDSYREIKLKEIMNQACETAKELGIKIAGGNTEYAGGLEYPVISVTAIGHKSEYTEQIPKKKEYDIVMTKWMALGGTAVIATEKREEIISRLPAYYVDEAKELNMFYSIAKEAAVAVKSSGTIAMHDVSGGGIFTALWELGEKLGLGCQIELGRIPVRQETIEVCEFFDINPYRLKGDGSLLIVTDNAEELIAILEAEEIAATVIGHTTECIDRVVIRDDETRFLEPANGDDIMKVMW